MSSKNDVPHDVVIEILSKLPIKTIIRFRCVCKSWYATITNLSFITTHLNLSRTSSHYNHGYIRYSLSDPSETSKWCIFSDQSYVDHVEFETPFNCRPSNCLLLVGSVDGILCLVDDRSYCRGRRVYLWNPSIRKFKTLPSPSTVHCRRNVATFGFGFDRQSNDYKVVRILYRKKNYNAQWPPQVEVYTLSTDSWRRIEAIVPCYTDDQRLTAFDAFTNGSVHWLASKSVYSWPRDTIMAFDIGEEVFGEMKLPEYYYIHGTRPGPLWRLTSFEESLSLIHFYSYPGNSCCWIWGMREYGVVESWTKQFTIVFPDMVSVMSPPCFTKNDELLMKLTRGKIISYDLKSSQFKYHRIHWGNTWKIVPFMETIVLLDLENAENSLCGVCEDEWNRFGMRNLRLLIHNYKQVGVLFFYLLLLIVMTFLTVLWHLSVSKAF